MAKSYFAILGVTVGATPNEIRSAYRDLAKEYHPDHYKGDSAPFQQIQEAYHVLGDKTRRQEYESVLARAPKKPTIHQPQASPEPLVPERGPVDLGEISPVRSFQRFTPSASSSPFVSLLLHHRFDHLAELTVLFSFFKK